MHLICVLPQSPTTANINKSKKFITPNRFAALTPHEPESIVVDGNDTNEPLDLQNQVQAHTTNATPKVILPPPIFVIGVVDFLQLRNSFIDEIGLDGFTCKSTSYHPKIQITLTI